MLCDRGRVSSASESTNHCSAGMIDVRRSHHEVSRKGEPKLAVCNRQTRRRRTSRRLCSHTLRLLRCELGDRSHPQRRMSACHQARRRSLRTIRHGCRCLQRDCRRWTERLPFGFAAAMARRIGGKIPAPRDRAFAIGADALPFRIGLGVGFARPLARRLQYHYSCRLCPHGPDTRQRF